MRNPFKELLLFASGADLSILRRPDCAVENNKYIGIGATILATAVLASLSGGYALYTVFGSYPQALCFGALWGLIIFNLDRYIVSTMRSGRGGADNLTSTRQRGPWRELLKVLVRFVLAVFISFIITKPLELRLFEGEIAAQLDKENSDRVAESQRRVALEFPEIARLEEENRRLREEVREQEEHKDALHELAMKEALGKAEEQTTGNKGKGPVYKERWDAFEKAEQEWSELKQAHEARAEANTRRIAELRAAEGARLGEVGGFIRRSGGLLERLKTLSALTEQSSTVAWTNRFLILLFIMLETAPLLVKLLSDRGPYEEFYEAHELRVSLQQQREMSDLADSARTAVALGRQHNADLLSAGVQLSQGVAASFHTIAAAQIKEARREIIDMLVSRWKAAEMERVKGQYPSPPHAGNGTHPHNGWPAAPEPKLAPEEKGRTESGAATIDAVPVAEPQVVLG